MRGRYYGRSRRRPEREVAEDLRRTSSRSFARGSSSGRSTAAIASPTGRIASTRAGKCSRPGRQGAGAVHRLARPRRVDDSHGGESRRSASSTGPVPSSRTRCRACSRAIRSALKSNATVHVGDARVSPGEQGSRVDDVGAGADVGIDAGVGAGCARSRGVVAAKDRQSARGRPDVPAARRDRARDARLVQDASSARSSRRCRRASSRACRPSVRRNCSSCGRRSRPDRSSEEATECRSLAALGMTAGDSDPDLASPAAPKGRRAALGMT